MRLTSFKYDFKCASVIERITVWREHISLAIKLITLFFISSHTLLHYCVSEYTYTFRNLILLNDHPLSHITFCTLHENFCIAIPVTLNRLGLERFKGELLKFNRKLLALNELMRLSNFGHLADYDRKILIITFQN